MNKKTLKSVKPTLKTYCHAEFISASHKSEILKQVQDDKRTAFTLAEVLITLTIIGVIAAITIPNLMKKWENHSNYVALKKNYSIMQNAYKLVEQEHGRYSDWVPKNGTPEEKVLGKTFAEMIKPYLKVRKSCQGYSCWYGKPKYLYKNADWIVFYAMTNDNSESFELEDGTLLVFASTSGSGTNYIAFSTGGFTYPTVYYYVDVNGTKGPNRFGRDVFIFGLQVAYSYAGSVSLPDQIAPAGRSIGTGYYYSDGYNRYCVTSERDNGMNGMGCAYKALKDEGIFY